jgi:hypothetical protein
MLRARAQEILWRHNHPAWFCRDAAPSAVSRFVVDLTTVIERCERRSSAPARELLARHAPAPRPGRRVARRPAHPDPRRAGLRDFLRSLAAAPCSSPATWFAEIAQTADEVIVIHRGRSIRQAPLDELMAASGGGVRVAGPDTGRLAGLLRADGASVAADGRDGAIVVPDRSGEQIGHLIAAHDDTRYKSIAAATPTSTNRTPALLFRC